MRSRTTAKVTQTKGSSDTHSCLSPNDEFADFELLPNFINIGLPSPVNYGFVRQSLLAFAVQTDVGPVPSVTWRRGRP